MQRNFFSKGLARLLGAFLALAVLFAPVTAQAMQMSTPAATGHQQTASSEHCDDATQPAKHDKAPQKNCCASMCMGVAINPVVPTAQAALVSALTTVFAPAFMLGSASELATPPPRRG